LNSENFLINNNTISKNNNNGILCITSVVTFEENIISENKNNGILLVEDNDVELTEN
jgi:parallel beta-helix repeat protein